MEELPELITWRQGRSLAYGEGVAFWALGEMVKAQAGVLESDTADVATDALAEAVSERCWKSGIAPGSSRTCGRWWGWRAATCQADQSA